MVVDMVPVDIFGAKGRNALEVAAVSLTAKEMDPMRMPCQMSGRIGWRQTIL
jgi:hypothetical protein